MVWLSRLTCPLLFPSSSLSFPCSDKALGMHPIHLTRTLYIEREDYREADSSDYFGLAPGKTAGLRYAGFVKVAEVKRDEAGNVSDPLVGSLADAC